MLNANWNMRIKKHRTPGAPADMTGLAQPGRMTIWVARKAAPVLQKTWERDVCQYCCIERCRLGSIARLEMRWVPLLFRGSVVIMYDEVSGRDGHTKLLIRWWT